MAGSKFLLPLLFSIFITLSHQLTINHQQIGYKLGTNYAGDLNS